MQFENIMSVVPAEFSMNGNSEEAVGQLVDLVQAAGGYGSLTIAGTKAALRKLAKIVPDKYFANSQREAKASTGTIGEWEGNNLMVADVKPIKLEYIGDTRTQEVRDGRINNDMTMELQVQTCFGIGLMLPAAFGRFEFA